MSMETFTGSALHTIDPKGRVFIPTHYRESLGVDFTIALNNDFRTIALYPNDIWRKKVQSYACIPDADRRGRNVVRHFMGNAYTLCNLDSQGRILIPQELRSMFDLTGAREIRFIGVGDYLEIWNPERYHGLMYEPDEIIDRELDYVYETYFSKRNTTGVNV
ncbi:MAG: division/cell wall cluster transcriptional repressor MraZ [Clostridia bacterium]|nr:division/cell wall cluster transcriptional repressor MraZ [Clostridia bacterium]